MIDNQVASDTKQKSLEQTFGQVVPAIAIKTQQCFLDEIFRQMLVARVAYEKSKQRSLPETHQLVKSC